MPLQEGQTNQFYFNRDRGQCHTYNARSRNGSPSMGYPGQMYGYTSMPKLYLGSGGGSGGNALDFSTNPKGKRNV